MQIIMQPTIKVYISNHVFITKHILANLCLGELFLVWLP